MCVTRPDKTCVLSNRLYIVYVYDDISDDISDDIIDLVNLTFLKQGSTRTDSINHQKV